MRRSISKLDDGMVQGGPEVRDILPFGEQELELSVPARFREVVERLGPYAAIRVADSSITFQALDQQSSALMAALLDAIAERRVPVALAFNHGISHNIAQLAVLKAGMFFVNIDVNLSRDRLLPMLEDIGAKTLLTDGVHEERAQSIRRDVPEMKVINTERAYCSSGAVPVVEVTPDDIASIVYTSGSTGPPRGVLVTHRNLLFIARTHGCDFRLSTRDKATQVCPLWTIAANSEIFSALLNGVCLYPLSIKQAGISRYLELLRRESITTFTASPALFRILFAEVKDKGHFPSVRLIRLGGDRTTRLDFTIYCQVFEDSCVLRLGYGSSEFVLATQVFLSKDSQFSGEVLPIGYPIGGCEVLLMNDGKIVSGSGSGEILVRSKQLSPGYWNNPRLTCERFEQTAMTERTYFTRDMGYRDTEGCLFHTGRSDSYIKIYGKMVLLDEVEAVLLSNPGIKEAVVIPLEKAHGDFELTGFVVLDEPVSDQRANAQRIRSGLLKMLAPELVPRRIVILPQLPLLRNNKIDRMKLKEIAASEAQALA